MEAQQLSSLVEAAQGGDEGAFEQLIAGFERQVLAHFLGQTPSVSDAEELAHDTFVRAYMHLARLKDPAQFPSWLFGIARNCYREWSRDRKKRANPPLPIGGERTEILKRKAVLHRQIYAIVYDLPDPYREVLSLRYFAGSSCAEIADMLSRSVGTVTKQISRGHALVAQSLKKLQGFTTLLDFWLPKEGGDRD